MSVLAALLTPAQKAAQTRKFRIAAARAHNSGQNAKTFTKYMLSKLGYKHLSLDSKKGYEYKGVVDLLAVKRDTKNPDRLKILLLQTKGGSARVTPEELRRLKIATRTVKIGWNAVEKPGTAVRFRKKLEE